MKSVPWRLLIIFALLTLTGCGRPTLGNGTAVVEGNNISSRKTFLNIAISSVEVLQSGNDLDKTEELRLIMVAATEDKSTGLMCPGGDDPLVTQVNQTVKPCLGGISINDEELPEKLALYIVGVDEDKLSKQDALTVNLIISGIGTVLGSQIGGGLIPNLVFDAVYSELSGDAKDYFEDQDVLGSQGILLERKNNWSAGKDMRIITQDQGLRLTLSIQRSSSNPENFQGWILPEFISTPQVQKGENIDQGPEDLIRKYYTAISRGDTQSSWEMLTQHFKDENNSKGYAAYAEWFATVDEVQVLSTEVITINGNKASLRAELAYFMIDGRKDPYDLMQFELVRASSSSPWMIDDAAVIKDKR